MTNNDDLERQNFEAACRAGLVNGGMAKDDHGNYYSKLTYASWEGWQARAKQESNHD